MNLIHFWGVLFVHRIRNLFNSPILAILDMLYPTSNTRIDMWIGSDTNELDMMKSHNTVNQLRL